ncbi:hypothetical protein MBLNU459_g8507t1 [Dothideomycetes sp. NU459]
MAAIEDKSSKDGRAYNILVRLALPPYTIHFKSATYMKEATMEMLDKRVCKECLKATAQRPEVREAIGTDATFWNDMVVLFRAAIPSLERRSFAVWDPSSVDYESTSGALIAAHYPGLWKDLERLNDLVSISRNILTIGERAQDLAAECAFDQEVFRLVNCCVRVTARGFDGDTGTGDEEKWQWIVNAYKKLLITSLQFLNNLVAQNERRKLMLWVALFDNSTEGILAEDMDDSSADQSKLGKMPEPPVSTGDILVALGETSQAKVDAAADALRAKRLLAGKDQLKPPSRPVSGYVLFVKDHQADVREALGASATPDLVAKNLAGMWSKISDKDRQLWNKHYDTLMQQYEKDMAFYNDAKRNAAAEKAQSDRAHTNQVAARIAQIEEQLSDRFRIDGTKVAPLELPVYGQDGAVMFPDEKTGPRPVSPSQEDYKMLFTASAGTKILESGKSELLKRLETYPVPPSGSEIASPSSPIVSSASSPVYNVDDPPPALEDMSEEEESEEEDEYPGSTEDGRGLLTDVPLILGPSEIEVLPMIVMSGIVPPGSSQEQGSTSEETNAIVNMHTVRCHLLLAQDNGKNLLRELLIFVAAWDLREEELYFKFMVKIMEAILVNGLMPYAYHAFRESVFTNISSQTMLISTSKSRSKDIISPAQAVIMKLLTNIFRSRAESSKSNPPPSSDVQSYPLRVDVHIVNFIFTEFRQHIIPQTCALIFLQGKIHQNLASPEDFPLNLWDMERMYEGVYQYLEFFAVLTEESIWKDVMAQWEVASELVTLLKELEAAIPKLGPGGATHSPSPRRAVTAQQGNGTHHAPPPPPPPAPQNAKAAPVSVERPFEVSPDLAPTLPPLPAPPTETAAPNNTIFEAETPLAYPEDPQDEPSDFEWRNLKKLTVLVLSSLIWKNKKVQDQVREYGGLEALVGCCRHDEHNPYIREHAIMCLRFAVEGNEDNAKVIKGMAGVKHQEQQGPGGSVTLGAQSAPGHYGEGSVPQEVLDTNGYETFMDGKGQVGLRRKDNASASANANTGATATAAGAATAAGSSAAAQIGPAKPKTTTKMTAEKAAELMQTALRDLPLGDKILGDKEKKEALAKLDRAFEAPDKAAKGGRR